MSEDNAELVALLRAAFWPRSPTNPRARLEGAGPRFPVLRRRAQVYAITTMTFADTAERAGIGQVSDRARHHQNRMFAAAQRR